MILILLLKEYISFQPLKCSCINLANKGRGKKELAVECTICMEFNENFQVVATKCGHLYHETCLLEWFKQSSACPTCRVECARVSLRKIYVPVKVYDYVVTTTNDNNEKSEIAKQVGG